MKSTIEKLFYGALLPLEEVRTSKEQSECLQVADECDEKLSALFKENGEVLQLFQRFKDAVDENTAIEVRIFYKEGFRNGFRIALDAMDED